MPGGSPVFVDGDASGVAQLDIGAVEAGPLFTVTTELMSLTSLEVAEGYHCVRRSLRL